MRLSILPHDISDDTTGEAFRAFDRWCQEHDPDGKLDVLTAAHFYSVWASTNSIEPYLDPPRAKGGE